MVWGRNGNDQQNYDIVPGMVVGESTADYPESAMAPMEVVGEPYREFHPEFGRMAWFAPDGTPIRPLTDEEENALAHEQQLGSQSHGGLYGHLDQLVTGQPEGMYVVRYQPPVEEHQVFFNHPDLKPVAAQFLIDRMYGGQRHVAQTQAQQTAPPSPVPPAAPETTSQTVQGTTVPEASTRSGQDDRSSEQSRRKFRPIKISTRLGIIALSSAVGFGAVSWFPLTYGPQHNIFHELKDLPADFGAVLNQINSQPVEKKN